MCCICIVLIQWLVMRAFQYSASVSMFPITCCTVFDSGTCTSHGCKCNATLSGSATRLDKYQRFDYGLPNATAGPYCNIYSPGKDVNSAPSRRGGWGLAALSTGCCALLLAAAWVLEDEGRSRDHDSLPGPASAAACSEVESKGPRNCGDFAEEMARRETHWEGGRYSIRETELSAAT